MVPATPRVSTRTSTAGAPTQQVPNASELAQQKATFDERLRLYLEVEAVDRLLKNQLIAAFDDDHI